MKKSLKKYQQLSKNKINNLIDTVTKFSKCIFNNVSIDNNTTLYINTLIIIAYVIPTEVTNLFYEKPIGKLKICIFFEFLFNGIIGSFLLFSSLYLSFFIKHLICT